MNIEKMDDDSKSTPRQSTRRKSASSQTPSQHSKGGSSNSKADLDPDVDILLSLKDDTYKTVMIKMFQRLGSKTKGGASGNEQSNNEDEKEAAREVLALFKERSGRGGDDVHRTTTRFFKPESRQSSKTYIEVDEAAALVKITADIYRRMESAKRWMNAEDMTADVDKSIRKSSPPLQLSQDPPPETTEKETSKKNKKSTPPSAALAKPRRISTTQQATSAAKPPPPKSAVKKNTKRKLLNKRAPPQSLPFLTDTNVADIILEEELRPKKKNADGSTSMPDDQIWQQEEVINFFRGLYVHGWGNTEKVSKMIKTRSSQQVKSYAVILEKKFPELKKFFSSKQVHKMQGKHGVKVKRYGNGNGVGISASATTQVSGGGAAKQLKFAPSNNDPAILAASVIGAMRKYPTPASAKKVLTKPKVVICLGDHIIDTESDPSLIQPSANRKRPADTLPDYFDPSVRPSVPTNCQQIFIPGNKVYARWLNRDDPGSYGTWYPGFIQGSKIAPIQDAHNLTGIPNLLYHVKFEDSAESIDLDTEDIIMHDQYQVWLKDLEQYYSLPVAQEMTWKRLTKNARVYAKWIDPTDPELHGSWMSGKVHSSQTWEDDANQWRHSYHIYFDNGDQDEDLQDGDVVEEETYKELLSEKMERGRKKSRLSGFDLIAEASEIASPIKTGQNRHNGTSIATTPAKKKLYSEDVEDASDDDSQVEGLRRCNEVLESRLPSPTHVARLSSTPSPDVHYGIYMKTKPWKVNFRPKNNEGSAPQDQSKSDKLSQGSGLNGFGASNVTPESILSNPNNCVSQDPSIGTKFMQSPSSDNKQSQEQNLNGIGVSNNTVTKQSVKSKESSKQQQPKEPDPNPTKHASPEKFQPPTDPDSTNNSAPQDPSIGTKSMSSPSSTNKQSQEQNLNGIGASNKAVTKQPATMKESPKQQQEPKESNPNPTKHASPEKSQPPTDRGSAHDSAPQCPSIGTESMQSPSSNNKQSQKQISNSINVSNKTATKPPAKMKESPKQQQEPKESSPNPPECADPEKSQPPIDRDSAVEDAAIQSCAASTALTEHVNPEKSQPPTDRDNAVKATIQSCAASTASTEHANPEKSQPPTDRDSAVQ